MSASKIQPQGDCAACDRRWREYAHAIAEHVKIKLDLYMAGSNHDWATGPSLHEMLTLAEARRDDAGNAVREHEAVEHNAGLARIAEH